MLNTIRLLRGRERLNSFEYKKFNKGDAIMGDNRQPEELARWNISDKEKAQEELKKYRCSYTFNNDAAFIEEYALEYFESDEEGDFVQGSDFDFAEV